jgi:hypothetical protein
MAEFAELALILGAHISIFPADWCFGYLEKALRVDVANHGIELHLK